ncbi:MAG TPA: AprI/Inh family metalloprotease inhibitor [Caulobacteraceae bacterium]|jgi:hypothetical protein
MKTLLAAAALAALTAGPALAWDHEAGVPLTPAEAAGTWTLEAQGHAVCSVRLSANHGAQANGDCGGMLPAGVAGWQATSDGMALTDQSGQVLMPFGRWSNSLFVSKKGSGHDVQLQRGAATP